MKTKKIAIVHDFLVRYGGAEALVKAWAEEFPEAPIFTLFYDEKKMEQFFPKERIKTSYLQKWYNLTKRYTWMLPFMPMAIESFDLSEYDIILSSSSAFSHGVLTNYQQKHISYVHSPMRWAWDWHFEFMKERKMGFIKKWFFQKIVSKIRLWDEITAIRPDMILSASTAIQKRIKKYWCRDSEVVFPFADLERFNITNKKQGKSYFLVVAQLVPYKKIEIAIRACEELGLPLKIVGEGISRKSLEEISGDHTEFLGAKYGDELVEIMQNAKAFLFPSVDDFGITPVEAMACGVPVIAYKKGGALDTIKEGFSGVFFEEQNAESLKKVLKETNFDKFDSQKIRKVAEVFSKRKHLESIKTCILN